ncbi:MAG: DUF4230 domain-containing protein [Chloroflexi bacterium]|nr:DUF4230 domain-containing protein [Chloroflexota bacterium]MDA1240240.1 DUF4230 domain-containing protein [Chloroflexota bacterium]
MGIGIAFCLVSLIFIAILLIGGVLWIGGRIEGVNPFKTEPIMNVGPTVIESIRELSDLVTVEVVEYTTIERGQDAGFLNFFRGDRIFLFAVARIGAGVDLAQLRDEDVEVDREANSVRIRLPEAKILYAALDNESTQVYDRETGIFRGADRDLESQARLAAEQILREQALTAGILEHATANAKTTLETFLHGLGFEQITILGAFDEVPATR